MQVKKTKLKKHLKYIEVPKVYKWRKKYISKSTWNKKKFIKIPTSHQNNIMICALKCFKSAWLDLLPLGLPNNSYQGSDAGPG